MDVNLVLFKKDGSHKSFSLTGNITVIGRRHDCDLQIPLNAVSRRHCQVYANEATLKIRDLGSRNGTYVNGKRIEEASAKAGDYLRIGPLTFLLQIDNQPAEILHPEEAAIKAAAPKEPPKHTDDALEADEFPEFDDSDSFLVDLEDA